MIVTALSLERDAVLWHMSDQEDTTVDGLPAHRGTIGKHTAILVCLQGMGNVNAAGKTAALLRELRPQYVLLVGIAGGINKPTTELLSLKNQLLGDVLVAEQVAGYEFGKQKPDGLERRPRAYPASAQLLAPAKALMPSEWIQRIVQPRPDGTTGRVVPHVHFGTMGSGEKVITDPAFVDPIKRVWTELVGVEMEGFGVAWACHQFDPRAHFLLVKAICDWADPQKRDAWQPYAADAAASFAAAVLQRLTPPSQTAATQATMTPSPVQYPPGAKLTFIQRLNTSWRDTCDALDIPVHERNRFPAGDEARAIWEWLEVRSRLGDLAPALTAIGRQDLAEGLTANPR